MSAEPTSRSPSLLARAVLTLVLAVVGGAGAWIVILGWPGERAFLVQATAVAVLASNGVTLVLALALIWRTELDEVSRSLVVFLASLLAFFDLTLLPAVVNPWLLGEVLLGAAPRWLSSAAWLAIAGSMTAGAAALLRFSLYFPEPLTKEDLAVLLSRDREIGSTAVAKLWNLEGSLADRWPSYRRVAHRLGDLGRTRHLALFAGISALPAAFGLWGFHVSVALAVLGSAPSQGHFSATYALADEEGRKKVFWVLMALGALTLVLLVLVGYSFGYTAGHLGGAPWTELARRIQGLGWLLAVPFTLALLLLVTCLAVGVFWSGAVNPSLVLRRTAVYGAAGTGFLFLVGVLEALVSDALTARFDLPGGATTWVFAGGLAVALRPAGRLLDRTLGEAVFRRVSAFTSPGSAPGDEDVHLVALVDVGRKEREREEVRSVFSKAGRKAANRHGARVLDCEDGRVHLALPSPEAGEAAAHTLANTVRVACEVLDLPPADPSVGVAGSGRGGATEAERLARKADPGQVLGV